LSTHKEPVKIDTDDTEETRRIKRRYVREIARLTLTSFKANEEKEALRKRLFTDDLTELPNSTYLKEKLPELIEIAMKEKIPLAFAFLDVDGLKRTNDKDGHEKGDQLLQSVGPSFMGLLREGDIVGRFSGDEFWAILPGYSPIKEDEDQEQAIEELNKEKIQFIKRRFKEETAKLGIPDDLRVGISIGIAILREGEDARSLISRADTLMQIDKQKNYNDMEQQGIRFYDSRK
jgi:diguanylate cyclase (GGDEF)-like protein